MRILRVELDTGTSHEYGEFYTWKSDGDVLHVLDETATLVADYNWNQVVYIRHEDKADETN